MNKQLKRYSVIGAIFVLIIGTTSHFCVKRDRCVFGGI